MRVAKPNLVIPDPFLDPSTAIMKDVPFLVPG
jgi:hypothetical protein